MPYDSSVFRLFHSNGGMGFAMDLFSQPTDLLPFVYPLILEEHIPEDQPVAPNTLTSNT